MGRRKLGRRAGAVHLAVRSGPRRDVDIPGDFVGTSRGDAAAATWIFRAGGDESRRARHAPVLRRGGTPARLPRRVSWKLFTSSSQGKLTLGIALGRLA